MKRISLVVVLSFFFFNCHEKITKEEETKFKGRGLEIVQSATQELGSNLMGKMKEGGVETAIPFCHARALPITEKIAKNYQAEIIRTSHKIRNPKNKPTQEDSEILKKFLSEVESDTHVNPILQKNKDHSLVFYAPILMQKQCLACHGKPGMELAVRTDSILKTYYPEDQATGFKEGDLRGMWKITFKN